MIQSLADVSALLVGLDSDVMKNVQLDTMALDASSVVCVPMMLSVMLCLGHASALQDGLVLRAMKNALLVSMETDAESHAIACTAANRVIHRLVNATVIQVTVAIVATEYVWRASMVSAAQSDARA